MLAAAPDRRKGAGRASLRAGAAALICLILLLGCASNPRILRIFFDGVPDPEEKVERAKTGAEIAAEKAPTAAPPVPRIWKHGPYESGECTLCHAGRSSQRLRVPRGKLCQGCHTGEGWAGEFVHGPVAGGQCGGCHEPHQSRLPHLLRREGPEICLHCHSPETSPQIAQHREDTGGECLECHRPHASDQPYLLR